MYHLDEGPLVAVGVVVCISLHFFAVTRVLFSEMLIFVFEM